MGDLIIFQELKTFFVLNVFKKLHKLLYNNIILPSFAIKLLITAINI